MSSIRTGNKTDEPSSFVHQEVKADRKALSLPAPLSDRSMEPEVFTRKDRTTARVIIRHQPEVFTRKAERSMPSSERRSRILVHPAHVDEIIMTAHAAKEWSRHLTLPDLSYEDMMNLVVLQEDPGVDELVVLARERDEEAIEELHQRFLGLIHSLYRQMELPKKVSFEDWEMEARINLMNCIELYTPQAGSHFPAYYKTSLRNLGNRLLRDAGRKGRAQTAMTFSDLESLAPEDFRAEDVVIDQRNQKEELEAARKFHAFLEDVRENHSDRAAEMLLKRARGYRINEQAGVYEMTPDAVSGLFRRLRCMYRRFDTQYNR